MRASFDHDCREEVRSSSPHLSRYVWRSPAPSERPPPCALDEGRGRFVGQPGALRSLHAQQAPLASRAPPRSEGKTRRPHRADARWAEGGARERDDPRFPGYREGAELVAVNECGSQAVFIGKRICMCRRHLRKCVRMLGGWRALSGAGRTAGGVFPRCLEARDGMGRG